MAVANAKFFSTPREYQYRTIDFGLSRQGRCCYWLDVGLGKTLCALYTAALLETRAILVVCPSSVVRNWREQVREHTSLKLVSLAGVDESGKCVEAAERKRRLEDEDGDVFLINYEGLRSIWSRREPLKRGSKKTRYRLIPYFKKQRFDCLIIDESHALSDPSSLHTRICYQLSKRCKHVILMTGTPDNGKLLDLWGQMWVLDGGATLGSRVEYLGRYFKSFTMSSRGRQFRQFYPKEGAFDQVMSKVSNSVIRFSREDCLDLPESTHQVFEVEPSAEQLRLVSDFRKEVRTEIAGKIIPPSVVFNKSQKLCQVSSGFYLHAERALSLSSNPKLKAVGEFLRGISERVVIYHTFVEEGRMLEGLCSRMGIKCACLRSEVRNKEREYSSFVDGSSQVLIAHPKSGGEGLNLQFASVMCFFSVFSLSPSTRIQTEGRIYRSGQKNSCVFIDFLVRGTLDRLVYNALMEGKDVAQAVVDWVKQGN